MGDVLFHPKRFRQMRLSSTKGCGHKTKYNFYNELQTFVFFCFFFMRHNSLFRQQIWNVFFFFFFLVHLHSFNIRKQGWKKWGGRKPPPHVTALRLGFLQVAMMGKVSLTSCKISRRRYQLPASIEFLTVIVCFFVFFSSPHMKCSISIVNRLSYCPNPIY